MPEPFKNERDLAAPDLSGAQMHSIEMSYKRRLLEQASPEVKQSLKALTIALGELQKSIGPDGLTPWSNASSEEMKSGNSKLEIALKAAEDHLTRSGVLVAQGSCSWEKIVQILPSDNPQAHPLNLMAQRLLRIDDKYLLGFSPTHSAYDSGAARTGENLVLISCWMASYAFAREDRSETSLGHEVSHALYEKLLVDKKHTPYYGSVALRNGTFPLVYAGYEEAMNFSELPAFRLEVNRHLINWRRAKEAKDELAMENTRVNIIDDSSSGIQLCKNTLWVLNQLSESLSNPRGSRVETTLLLPDKSGGNNKHQIKARFLSGITEVTLRFPLLEDEIQFSESAVTGALTQLLRDSVRLLREATLLDLAFFDKAYNSYRLKQTAGL